MTQRNRNPFGGLFDFNRDGKEDLGEQWLGFNMFEEFENVEGSSFWTEEPSSPEEPDESDNLDVFLGGDLFDL